MNFCREDAMEDIPRLFGDNSDEVSDDVVFFHHGTTLADLAVKAGIFQSKNQARKNGWAGPIPSGYSEYGSKKNRIYISNPMLDQHIWSHPCWVLYDITGVLNWSVR